MRQVFYVSRFAEMVDQDELDAIVQRSRHNNALDGITGILWVVGDRFAQVLEGDEDAIDDAMGRIRADRRHRDIVMLHDRTVLERQFGGWTMALRGVGANADRYDGQLREALAAAPQDVRDVFAGLVAPPAA